MHLIMFLIVGIFPLVWPRIKTNPKLDGFRNAVHAWSRTIQLEVVNITSGDPIQIVLYLPTLTLCHMDVSRLEEFILREVVDLSIFHL